MARRRGRAPWQRDAEPDWTSLPVARLRYTAATKTRALLWRDRNLRFHSYDEHGPTQRIDDLLAELDRDPTGIFWG